jgi:transmembrane sensor
MRLSANPRESTAGRADTEALQWLVKAQSDDFSASDWEAFEAWLASDPAHRDAYDRWLQPADKLEAVLPQLRDGFEAAQQPRAGAPTPWAPTPWAWMRVAASVVVVVGAGLLVYLDRINDGRSVIATGAGQSRTLTLENGASIALGPDARIELTSHEGRIGVRIKRGEIRFRCPDPMKPVLVTAGDDILRIASASAEVQRRDGHLQVHISEGAVPIGPATGAYGPRMTLPAGGQLFHVEGTTVFDVRQPGAAPVIIR